MVTVETWRDRCPHSPECQTESDCNAIEERDASKVQPSREEQPMPSKTKKTNPPNPDTHEPTERETERALMISFVSTVIPLVEEQGELAFAQRFAAYAAAAKDLTTLGAFPAVEQIRLQLLNELTVMGRSLHEARLA